jgi:hypothetical protein
MRETLCMVEGDYDDVELATEGSMTLKVMALLLKPLLQRRRVDDVGAPWAVDGSHQQPEGLQHHQPRLCRINSPRGSVVIDSATSTTRGASASSTPPPPQQQLEKQCHHIQCHRPFRRELDIIIISFNHSPIFPHKHQPRGARGRGTNLHKKIIFVWRS